MQEPLCRNTIAAVGRILYSIHFDGVETLCFFSFEDDRLPGKTRFDQTAAMLFRTLSTIYYNLVAVDWRTSSPFARP